MLVALSFAWGFTWPAMRIALDEMSPFGLRSVSAVLGAMTLFALGWARRRSFYVPRHARVHLAVAALFNIVGFTLLTSFAQLATATLRVAILAYTMPIWASLLAIPILGERLNARRVTALALCVAGLAVLTYPLIGHALPTAVFLAVGAALCWAIGTVYLKWVKIEADPVAVAGWQLVGGAIIVTAALPFFEGFPDLLSFKATTLAAIAFSGVVGAGFAYFLWFSVVDKISTMTASLGSLNVPVIGVFSSMAILGERPSLFDIIGFVLILAAASCVLFQSDERAAAAARAEPTV